jgi:DNA-binding winged helix-turn-helix (wHTH) protein
MTETVRERRVRFGPFEVDFLNRELRRQGVRLRVQRQPFSVLEALVESPGDLVTREALRQRLWSDGTFVEFDKGLNTAVMKLREALGEDSQSPHFIETVAGEGYRFVAPVEVVAVARDPAPALGPPGVEDRVAAVDETAVAMTDEGADRRPRRTSVAAKGWLALAVLLLVGAAGAVFLRPDSPSANSQPLRFTLQAPAGTALSTSGSSLALSPDGRAIVFLAAASGEAQRLWLQPLDSLSARPLEGTENASQPFWSPDGRSLAFFAHGRLKRLDLARGTQRTLDTVRPVGVAGAWSDDGRLLFSRARAGSSSADHRLELGSAEGGPSTTLPLPSGLDPTAYLWWPRFLPGGRSFLFLALGSDPERNGIHAATLDGGPAHRISPAISSVEYADGRLFYVDGGMLMAQPFDAERLRTTGKGVPLADGVLVNPRTGRGAFSVSGANGGILAYRQPARSRLEWFDRGGASLGVAGRPAVYFDFSIAPDGERIAASILDPERGTHDLWIQDAAGARRRLTEGLESEIAPVWSADGSRIAYASEGKGRWRVLVKSILEGEPELVAESSRFIAPAAWKSDLLVIGRSHPKVEIEPHPMSSGRVLAEPWIEVYDQVSPDGRHIAWIKDDTSQSSRAIYVAAMAPEKGSWHVADRGDLPRWRADGGELYYLAEGRRMMAVRVDRGPSLDLAAPAPLFVTTSVEHTGLEGRTYDVSPDGERFLLKVADEPAVTTVLANWKALVEGAEAPAKRGP